jgi:zinc transporter 2
MADPICTYLFSVIVVITTIPIVGDCINVLLEGTPKDIDIEDLYNSIYDIVDV